GRACGAAHGCVDPGPGGRGSIDAGRLRLDVGRLDPGEALRSIAAEFEPIAAEKGIDIECRVQGDLPPVNADRLRIGQALANLIGNALKFTEPGGSVEVSVQSTADAVLRSEERRVGRGGRREGRRWAA